MKVEVREDWRVPVETAMCVSASVLRRKKKVAEVHQNKIIGPCQNRPAVFKLSTHGSICYTVIEDKQIESKLLNDGRIV